MMVLFAILTIVGALIALKYRPPRLVLLLQAKMDTSAQLPVRVAILVLAAVTILACTLGSTRSSAALAAGVLVALGSTGHFRHTLHRKLDGIGFGFFVPIFFVTTGLRYDLHALFGSRLALVQLPMFLAMFFVVLRLAGTGGRPSGARSAFAARSRPDVGDRAAAGDRDRGDRGPLWPTSPETGRG